MLYVLIPVHNRREITLRCLRALETQTLREFRTVVVDDGSTDGTSTAIAEEFPDVVVLRGDGNLWWAGAVNKALDFCKGQGTQPCGVVLLNDDVQLEPEFLEVLKDESLQHPRALIGAVATYFDSPECVYWCGESQTHRDLLARRVLRSQLAELLPVEAIPGRGVLIPWPAIEAVGGMNAKVFPQYFADVDFSRRAVTAGHQLLCTTRTSLQVLETETALGSPHRSTSFLKYMASFGNRYSPNHLSTLWAFHRRHGSAITFAFQLVRLVGGDFLRRTGLR